MIEFEIHTRSRLDTMLSIEHSVTADDLRWKFMVLIRSR